MKKLLYFFAATFFVAITQTANAQEVVVDGNMEYEESWTIVDLAAGNGHTETFNYTGDLPEGGEGGCLRLQGEGAWSNVAVCQELYIEKGVEYKISMLIKTAQYLELQKNWVEVAIVPEMPAEDGDITAYPILFALNSWDCPDDLFADGNFADFNCDAKTELNDEIFYEGTGDTTVVLVLKAGGDNVYDILFDNVSVLGDAVGIENTAANQGFNQVYPNPATDQITLRSVDAETVEIFDAIGRRVYHTDRTREGMTIDIANFRQGMYFVKAGNTVTKLIKE
jgi:hypothetical protein